MKVKNICLSLIVSLGLSLSTIDTQASEIRDVDYDGCSNLNSLFTWSGWNNVCNTHDWQYSRFGTSRSSADSNLKNNLKKRCNDKYKWYDPRRDVCRNDADIVYAAVRAGGHSSFSGAQESTESAVIDWVNTHSSFFAIESTYTPSATLWFTDQPIYKHHMDKKYVDLLIKVRGPGNMSVPAQWESLRSAIYEGREGYNNWKTNLLSQLGLQACPGGTYLEVCPPPVFDECGGPNLQFCP